MGAAGYYIFLAFFKTVTILPLSILYIFSYPLYFVFYYFPGYRRKITRTNLINSFPEKSLTEIRHIEKRFYMHLADLFIEGIKASNMKASEFRIRYRVVNPELPERLLLEGRDIITITAHFNNWEWLVSLPLYLRHQMIAIYKPLKSKRFDRFMHDSRARFGTILTPMSGIVREIITKRGKGVHTMSLFLSDQSPPRRDIKYRTTFLNQDSPVYTGAGKMAVKFNMAVLFLNVQKLRRGHYEVIFEELFSEAGGLEETYVTEAHVRRLEQLIREAPENWIWTHRRWKHSKTEPDDKDSGSNT